MNKSKIVFYICVTIILCVLFISCTVTDRYEREIRLEREKIPKSDFEICVDSCPSAFTGKNQECVDKCIRSVLDCPKVYTNVSWDELEGLR